MSLQAIESLKHFAGKANELQSLRDRVEELEELLGIAGEPFEAFHSLPLTPPQKAILGLLYKGKMVRRETAYTAIYGGRAECDQPDERIIDVRLVVVRKVLSQFDIFIETQWGVGWFMTAENKEKLRELIQA